MTTIKIKRQLCKITIWIIFLAPCHLFSQGLSPSHWREDILYLQEKINYLHPASDKKGQNALVAQILAKLDTYSEDQIIGELSSLLASFQDGHTELIPLAFGRSPLSLSYLPFSTLIFGNEVYLRSTTDQELTGLVGNKITRIGSAKTSEILQKLSVYISADNHHGAEFKGPMILSCVNFLCAAEVVSDKDHIVIEFETRSGEKKNIVVRSTTVPSMMGHGGSQEVVPPDAALYRKNSNTAYALNYLAQHKTLFLNYRTITSDPQFPLNKLMDSIAHYTNNFQIDKFIIDIRDNGGGNLGASIPLVQFIARNKKLNQYGKLYVLTGAKTFSAASFFLTKLMFNTQCIVVGEPTGAGHNHFGDPRPVILPNSKLFIRISSAFWQNSLPNDDNKQVLPNIEIDLNAADYFSFKDPILDKVLTLKSIDKRKPLTKKQVSFDTAGVYQLTPVHLGRFGCEGENIMLHVAEIDFEGRNYPFLTTALYHTKNQSIFSTDIQGLEVVISNEKTLRFLDYAYPLITQTKWVPTSLQEVTSDFVQALIEDLTSYARSANKAQLKITPDYHFVRLSNSLLKINLKNESAALLKLGLDFHPRSSSIYYALADLYKKNNNLEKAIFYFKQSLSVSQDDEWVKQIISKLEAETQSEHIQKQE